MNFYNRIGEIRHLLHMLAAPTIYNEEAYTNRELGIATAKKLNSVIDVVNKITESLDALLDDIQGEIHELIQKSIDDGEFNIELDGKYQAAVSQLTDKYNTLHQLLNNLDQTILKNNQHTIQKLDNHYLQLQRLNTLLNRGIVYRYYVDGVNGNDDNDGLTPETAHKTLAPMLGDINNGYNMIRAYLISAGTYEMPGEIFANLNFHITANVPGCVINFTNTSDVTFYQCLCNFQGTENGNLTMTGAAIHFANGNVYTRYCDVKNQEFRIFGGVLHAYHMGVCLMKLTCATAYVDYLTVLEYADSRTKASPVEAKASHIWMDGDLVLPATNNLAILAFSVFNYECCHVSQYTDIVQTEGLTNKYTYLINVQGSTLIMSQARVSDAKKVSYNGINSVSTIRHDQLIEQTGV